MPGLLGGVLELEVIDRAMRHQTRKRFVPWRQRTPSPWPPRTVAFSGHREGTIRFIAIQFSCCIGTECR